VIGNKKLHYSNVIIFTIKVCINQLCPCNIFCLEKLLVHEEFLEIVLKNPSKFVGPV
jgi:hypothetical protein